MEVQGEIDLDLVFEGERLAEILDFWRKACTGRTMPTRQDIDPLTIPPHLLAHIELIDVLLKAF